MASAACIKIAWVPVELSVETILAAHVEAGKGRFRGVRVRGAAQSADPNFPKLPIHTEMGLYLDARFHEGFALLRDYNLTFDAWLFHSQIKDLTLLARKFPEQPIVLDHVGTPLGISLYANKRDEIFSQWKVDITELSTCPNVFVKLGGLAIALCGFDFHLRERPPTSSELAQAWKPYFETCIELFGADRCMFEAPDERYWRAIRQTS